MISAITAGNLDTSPPSVHLILSQRKRKRKILNTPYVIVATNSSQREHSNGTRKIAIIVREIIVPIRKNSSARLEASSDRRQRICSPRCKGRRVKAPIFLTREHVRVLVERIFRVNLQITRSVYRVIGARKITVRVKMKNTSASAEAAEVTSPSDR